jgi:hypothetical protein
MRSNGAVEVTEGPISVRKLEFKGAERITVTQRVIVSSMWVH